MERRGPENEQRATRRLFQHARRHLHIHLQRSQSVKRPSKLSRVHAPVAERKRQLRWTGRFRRVYLKMKQPKILNELCARAEQAEVRKFAVSRVQRAVKSIKEKKRFPSCTLNAFQATMNRSYSFTALFSILTWDLLRFSEASSQM